MRQEVAALRLQRLQPSPYVEGLTCAIALVAHHQPPEAAMPSRSDLSGLRLFVTGAGSGIGRALLAMALADGAKVAALARDDAEAAALQAILPARQVLVRDLLADGPENVASAAADRLDGLDGYAGCAGLFDHRAGLDTDRADWDRTIDLNLSAGFVLARDAARAMKACPRPEGAGAIVLVSSQIGMIGHPRAAAYAASKAGLNGLAKALAIELAPRQAARQRGRTRPDRYADDGRGPRGQRTACPDDRLHPAWPLR